MRIDIRVGQAVAQVFAPSRLKDVKRRRLYRVMLHIPDHACYASTRPARHRGRALPLGRHIRRWGEPAMKALRAKWQSAIYYTKLALHTLGLSSLVALIAVIVIEFTWPTARHFFSGYPVTLGLIAGLLNLIFTLSVVNRIIQQRDE